MGNLAELLRPNVEISWKRRVGWTIQIGEGLKAMHEAGLAQMDLKPSNITDLIVTHLHTDHAGNIPMFAKADTRIIVHEDELRGCITEKGGLLRDDLLTLWGVTSPQGFTRKDFACLLPDRATTVFGDQEIYRGVWTVSLPWHTWGTMGVAVNLPHSGWILIASDADLTLRGVNLNIFPAAGPRMVVNGSPTQAVSPARVLDCSRAFVPFPSNLNPNGTTWPQ